MQRNRDYREFRSRIQRVQTWSRTGHPSGVRAQPKSRPTDVIQSAPIGGRAAYRRHAKTSHPLLDIHGYRPIGRLREHDLAIHDLHGGSVRPAAIDNREPIVGHIGWRYLSDFMAFSLAQSIWLTKRSPVLDLTSTSPDSLPSGGLRAKTTTSSLMVFPTYTRMT